MRIQIDAYHKSTPLLCPIIPNMLFGATLRMRCEVGGVRYEVGGGGGGIKYKVYGIRYGGGGEEKKR
ncbi:hypothetical protein A2524_03685 [Candidatus Wolfebacteria bacterium RIFOXYD12_FULL_48_21]|uniref:Uncharacterized protein n=1 Tax=Candidatus Wolfebacteria bacterium RIFOXYD1_FULL_48_65 TaxID=1802561 RepID=A0A1F8DZX0_9BACT|nr:MAG: hypothetical protein A2610_00225 [Candidatus Wolfebacteria bacterium RIFOXYD1_FULL_48_65]OGM95154.1 MAG: hypothetical protein A2524_03685 [Candidatus Wolfebacteria bacterium RIFOXYD12_FULL_48_21]OGM95754.1 MAG: hypothetical protein A2532_03510 [Candidatus Wolfebacteria bacterium RIFOXYD2_FULL_48_11]